MKKLIMTLAFMGLVLSASAIPAKRVNQVVRQSDGTTLTIQLRGDETFHYWVKSDGTPVRQAENGDWVVDSRDVRMMHQQAMERRNLDRQALAVKAHKAMHAVKAPYRADAASAKKGLLILVNFTDKKMSRDNIQDIFNQMLNGLNNPYGKNNGSIREYFRAQSYGQFDIEFDVVGPVTLSNNMAYYGGNDSNGDDKNPGAMIKEACQLVDDLVNFADYDWDGDGEVENIYVTYAGYGEASGAAANTIWPHQWALSSAVGSALRLDGVKVDTYACGSELQGKSGSTIDGIGTMCHEYSHCLGLPDFYDTAGNNYGMDAWSLMDYGCYNGDGFCPAGYTAYERWFSGWLEPIVLNEGCEVEGVKNIEQNPEAYILYNDKNKNEYYMLANHQKVDWDKQAPGHGMMVLHVDYNQTAWYNNVVNNTSSRQRMTIIPADNSLTSSSNSLDLWPSTRKKTELTDTSTPAAKTYNNNTDGQKLMHKPITNIAEANGLISFTFMGGKASGPAAPVLSDPFSGVGCFGFTATWTAVENAVSYNVMLTETAKEDDNSDAVLEALNMMEDFENFYVEDEEATADGSTDLSSKLDEYTYVPGWAGSKIYQGLFGAKLASSSAVGYLTTPAVEGTSGEVTVYLEAWDWFNYSTLSTKGSYTTDGTSVVVSLLGADGQELQQQTVATNDLMTAYNGGDYDDIFVRFSNVPSSYKIKVSTTGSKKRAYLSYFLCFDGNFSADEIYTLFEGEDDGGETQVPARISVRRHQLTPAARRAVQRRASESRIIEGVKTTTYKFTELQPEYTYTVQVQAVDAEGNKSGWSEAVSVTLPEYDPVGVSSVNSVNSTSGRFFDLQGRRVSSTARRGIYVVDGKKVVIK